MMTVSAICHDVEMRAVYAPAQETAAANMLLR